MALVGDAGDDGCLGEVGRKHVSAIDKVAHGSAQLVGVRWIFVATVAHHGIDDAQCRGMLAIEPLDGADLLGRSKKTRVDGVDLDALFDPSVKIGCQHVGRVVHVEDGEARVRREKRGGYRAHVAAGSREHGNGYSQRALAVATEVMYCGDTGNICSLAVV